MTGIDKGVSITVMPKSGWDTGFPSLRKTERVIRAGSLSDEDCLNEQRE